MSDGAIQPAPHQRSLLFRLRGFVPALISLATALGIHLLLIRFVSASFPGIFFVYLATILIAGWCGYGPGVLVVLLVACGVPFLTKPDFRLQQVDPAGVLILSMVSLMISGTAASRRKMERLLRNANANLDQRVREATTDLEGANRQLQHRVAELETLYSKVPVGLCLLDRELRYVRINEMMASFNGPSAADHVGKQLGEVLPQYLIDRVEPIYREVLETGKTIRHVEFEAPAPASGETGHWSLGCAAVLAQNGDIIGIQVTVEDITDRYRFALQVARSNAVLKETNAALSRANDDLGQFAYIAAHDLQEPLRTVVNFSQLVQRRCMGKLDAKSEEQLHFVVAAGKRMGQLISDVLAYSSTNVDEKTQTLLPTSLARVLQSVCDSLKDPILESGAEVEIDELPVVSGNERQLNQLFFNLIGNAIKYRRPDVAPKILVRAEHSGDMWKIIVSDNGQGFRQEYAERIFGIFRRLHGNETPGSGIGLAICKRVVERHGGTIWAESGIGQGASFYLTLRPAIGVQAMTAQGRGAAPAA